MTDTDDEIPDAVHEMYDKMLDLFERQQTEDVMSALQSVVSTVLCNASLSKEAAIMNIMMFSSGVYSAVEEADKDGACAWSERRH